MGTWWERIGNKEKTRTRLAYNILDTKPNTWYQTVGTISMHDWHSLKTQKKIDPKKLVLDKVRGHILSTGGDALTFLIVQEHHSHVSQMTMYMAEFFLIAIFCKNSTWKMWFRPIQRIFHGESGLNSPNSEKIFFSNCQISTISSSR
jgi:hypothetical protein